MRKKIILVFVSLFLVTVIKTSQIGKAATNDATFIYLPIVNNSLTTPVGDADILIDFSHLTGQAPATYGLNGWWTDEDSGMWNNRYLMLNPEVVRVPILHALIEPINDDSNPTHINIDGFNFNTPLPITADRHFTYHAWFSVLKENDVTIMVYIPYLAPWLSRAEGSPILEAPYPPNNIAEYQELIRALLNYLIEDIGFHPDNIILEPVNEPDLPCGADPAVACFWDNWQIYELAEVLIGAAQTANDIDPRIRIAGPSLCCNFGLLDQLTQSYNITNFLDVVTFHYYTSGNYNLSGLVNTYNDLKQFGKPVYLNEYGNTTYWSNGTLGALWHAAALSDFWENGIPPIQFSMAEIPLMHEGYNELGLFYSWEQGWQIKPAYWVYVNFFNHFESAELVHLEIPNGMIGVAGRQGDKTLALWIVNNNYQPDQDLIISIENWPTINAQVQVFNNLTGSSPVDSIHTNRLSNGEIKISYPVPPSNSLLFVFSEP
jgi:hypothetical protein